MFVVMDWDRVPILVSNDSYDLLIADYYNLLIADYYDLLIVNLFLARVMHICIIECASVLLLSRIQFSFRSSHAETSHQQQAGIILPLTP